MEPRRRAPHVARPRASRQLKRALPLARHSRAQAIVEFAIVVPVMLLLLLAAVDFGRLYFSYIGVNNAAREGAAYAQAHNGCAASSCSDILDHARQEMGGDTSLVLVSISCTASAECPRSIDVAGPAGDRVTVTVRYPFRFLTPLIGDLFGGQVWMTSSSEAVIP